jgi:UDP-N-acetylmuramoyl-L-alanyl-D-glutamate--2,6-diaminopimelate ligase
MGINPQRHLTAQQVHYTDVGLSLTVVCADQVIPMQTSFVGDYNASNLLGVLAALCELGFELKQAVAVCEKLPAVPGRMQQVASSPMVFVDYAHTPDALEKALHALAPLAEKRAGGLTCVVGCGGNRDRSKRPLMAAVAQKNSNKTVLTSDNPRDEAPDEILQQMRSGLRADQAVWVIEDRAQAIEQTVREANPEDVILIAGKGHEDYQEIAGVKHPFSDQWHVVQALEKRSLHV